MKISELLGKQQSLLHNYETLEVDLEDFKKKQEKDNSEIEVEFKKNKEKLDAFNEKEKEVKAKFDDDIASLKEDFNKNVVSLKDEIKKSKQSLSSEIETNAKEKIKNTQEHKTELEKINLKLSEFDDSHKIKKDNSLDITRKKTITSHGP